MGWRKHPRRDPPEFPRVSFLAEGEGGLGKNLLPDPCNKGSPGDFWMCGKGRENEGETRVSSLIILLFHKKPPSCVAGREREGGCQKQKDVGFFPRL